MAQHIDFAFFAFSCGHFNCHFWVHLGISRGHYPQAWQIFGLDKLKPAARAERSTHPKDFLSDIKKNMRRIH
jgi:hypothetical protein